MSVGTILLIVLLLLLASLPFAGATRPLDDDLDGALQLLLRADIVARHAHAEAPDRFRHLVPEHTERPLCAVMRTVLP